MDEIKIIPGMNGKVSKRPIQGKKNGLSKKSFEETLNSNILQSKTPQKTKRETENRQSVKSPFWILFSKLENLIFGSFFGPFGVSPIN